MMAGMITLILIGLLRGIRTHRALVLENLALRHQLAVSSGPRRAYACGGPTGCSSLKRLVKRKVRWSYQLLCSVPPP
jgi:hypothetical protein